MIRARFPGARRAADDDEQEWAEFFSQLSRTPAPGFAQVRTPTAPQRALRPEGGHPHPQGSRVPAAFRAAGPQRQAPAHRPDPQVAILFNGGWRPEGAEPAAPEPWMTEQRPALAPWAPPMTAGEMREARDLIAALPDAEPESPAERTPIGDEALAAVRLTGPQPAATGTAETAAPVAEKPAGPEPGSCKPAGGLLRAMLVRACWDAVQYYAPVDGECAGCRDGEVCDWHWDTRLRFAEFESLHEQLLLAGSDEAAITEVRASGVNLGDLAGWGSPFAAALEGGAR